jgi:hypothetical protein
MRSSRSRSAARASTRLTLPAFIPNRSAKSVTLRADAAAVARAVANVLGVPVEALGGRSRGEALQRARELVTLVGAERCGLKVKDLAVVIGRGAGSANCLYSRAAAVWRNDSAFAAIAEKVTQTVRKSTKKSWGRQ